MPFDNGPAPPANNGYDYVQDSKIKQYSDHDPRLSACPVDFINNIQITATRKGEDG